MRGLSPQHTTPPTHPQKKELGKLRGRELSWGEVETWGKQLSLLKRIGEGREENKSFPYFTICNGE